MGLFSRDATPALGTGAEVALGAVFAGATAKEAVGYAIKVDLYSGGKIVTESF